MTDSANSKQVIASMRQLVRKRLGEMLIEEGAITPEQLDEALIAQKRTGHRLGKTLVELGYVTEERIMSVLEKQLGIERLNIDEVNVDIEALERVPEALIKRHRVFPIGFADNAKTTLILAMVDPLNVFAVDDIEIASRLKVKPVLIADSEFEYLVNSFFGPLTAAQEALDSEVEEPEDHDEDLSSLDQVANEAPIVKLVNSIIYEAVRQGASDIHIEPQEKNLRVRFRIDGELRTTIQTSMRYHAGVTSRVKIMSGIDITERRIPQDGRIQRRIDGREVDFRVSTLPTIYGEKISIRVLDKSRLRLRIEDLDFSEHNYQRFKNLIERPYGLVLIAGPTGSGKTTTLYSAMSKVNVSERNLLTIENPVEFRLEGTNQVEVNEKVGMTFARALRAFLRQDPDVIVVGEIRDRETAEIAVQAALTGHLVLSTIHTNDAIGTVGRLIDMGIEPFLIASSVTGVVSQRLVRRICESCKEVYHLDHSTSLRFEAALGLQPGTLGGKTVFRGRGCARCGNTGYKGRVAIQEVLVITDRMRDMIIAGTRVSALRELAIEEGMIPIKEDGLSKMFSGITTPEELIKSFQSLE